MKYISLEELERYISEKRRDCEAKTEALGESRPEYKAHLSGAMVGYFNALSYATAIAKEIKI